MAPPGGSSASSAPRVPPDPCAPRASPEGSPLERPRYRHRPAHPPVASVTLTERAELCHSSLSLRPTVCPSAAGRVRHSTSAG